MATASSAQLSVEVARHDERLDSLHEEIRTVQGQNQKLEQTMVDLESRLAAHMERALQAVRDLSRDISDPETGMITRVACLEERNRQHDRRVAWVGGIIAALLASAISLALGFN